MHALAKELAVTAITDRTISQTILVFVGGIVTIGLLSVLCHRFIMQRRATTGPDAGMTRPVLAMLLVGTLLILAAASLSSKDADLRNLLVGGVISLSSGVVAFYFASSGATEARRDFLAANGEALSVPNLEGKTLQEAQTIISGTSLRLEVPDPAPALDARVTSQDPPAETLARGGKSVKLKF